MRSAKYAVIGIGVVLLAVMSYVVFAYDPPRADITWRTLRVEVGDPKQVRVTFEVDKAPLAAAECQVTAFAADHTSAGRLTGIAVGPRSDNARKTEVTVAVPTPLEPATTASVATCQITRTR
ncbi:MAG TPA: DUF4307 domain-containing protein [Mycobacteriales bacterium]|nr:DUF4307 domain-containing protein [Mycobacteriales bacterium]